MSQNTPIKVLVVDDSAFARKVLREILQAAGIEVVGIARDGLEALEQIAALKPDVVALDLVMPNLDGVGVLHAMQSWPSGQAPRVVVVSNSDSESGPAVEALQAGAVTIVHKPTALATAQLYELSQEFVAAVREAALARRVGRRSSVSSSFPLNVRPAHKRVVVIGTSTGGPQALAQLLAALPEGFPVPLAIALHIPAGYTEELSKRLDRNCAIDVAEAEEGMLLRPGLAVLARGGQHLTLSGAAGSLRAHLGHSTLAEPHQPSVDLLFESAALRVGADALGVVLTGMGSDGLRGSRAIHAAGGHILTEAEESCVVYGMPSVVKQAGLALAEAHLDDMAAAILRNV
jgi:two-component system chemotaxis response regulator CheB